MPPVSSQQHTQKSPGYVSLQIGSACVGTGPFCFGVMVDVEAACASLMFDEPMSLPMCPRYRSAEGFGMWDSQLAEQRVGKARILASRHGSGGVAPYREPFRQGIQQCRLRFKAAAIPQSCPLLLPSCFPATRRYCPEQGIRDEVACFIYGQSAPRSILNGGVRIPMGFQNMNAQAAGGSSLRQYTGGMGNDDHGLLVHRCAMRVAGVIRLGLNRFSSYWLAPIM